MYPTIVNLTHCQRETADELKTMSLI